MLDSVIDSVLLLVIKMASREQQVFVEFRNGFAILWLGSGENRFNNHTVKELHSALDQVEKNEEVQFLITIGKGKFFSNGLDLDSLVQINKKEMGNFLAALHALHIRILTFPVPTIAALNGHTFAAGAVFALSYDYQVMRTLRGWFCLPEIKLKLRFSTGMMSVLKTKITDPRVKTDCIIMGKRYTADDALSSKLVDQICDNSELLTKAIEFGWKVVGHEKFDREQMKALKSDLYKNVIEDLKSSTKVQHQIEGLSKL